MIEQLDDGTKLVYSYDDGGYYFMVLEYKWVMTTPVYKTREEAMRAYRNE